MAQSATHQFQAALAHLLALEGRGAQSRLARQQNIDRGYLNAIVKGRKSGPDEVRAQIAAHFDMTYEEMLALGRSILEGSEIELQSGAEKEGRRPRAGKSDKAGAGEKTISSVFPLKLRNTTPGILELITKAVEILESNTGYREVLAELIIAFHESGSMKNDNLKLRNQMKKMEARIASLEKSLAYEKDCTRKSA